MTNLSIKQINLNLELSSASTIETLDSNLNEYRYSYCSTHSGCSPVTDGGDI